MSKEGLGPYGDCQPFWNRYEPGEDESPIGGGVDVWLNKWVDDPDGDGFEEAPREEWKWVVSWTGPNLLSEEGEVQACDCTGCKGELSIYSHYILEYNMAGVRVKRTVTMNSISIPLGRGKRPKDVTVTVVRKEVQNNGE